MQFGRTPDHGPIVVEGSRAPALGGWEFSPILTFQTGLPLTILQSDAVNIGGERRSRPNRIGNGTLPDNQRNAIAGWIQRVGRLTNTPGQPGFFPNQLYGNSGVGVVRGPGSQNLDFNLAKDFRMTERFKAQFRAEFFNALNRANSECRESRSEPASVRSSAPLMLGLSSLR